MADAKAEMTSDRAKALTESQEQAQIKKSVQQDEMRQDSQSIFKDEYLKQPVVMMLLKGNEETLQQLR